MAQQDLPEIRLVPKWPAGTPLVNRYLGTSVAMTDKWMVATSSSQAAPENYLGAVHLFSAITGAWVRMLVPPATATVNDFFGGSVAVSGDLCFVGAYRAESLAGVVYVYNLATGALVRTMHGNAEGPAVRGFGWSLAAHSGRILVGAPSTDSSKGAAYLYTAATGTLQRTFVSPTAVNSENFAYSVALDGNAAAFGIPSRAASKGGAEVQDAYDGYVLASIIPSGAVAGSKAGYSIALNGGTVVMGAVGHNGNAGAVFTYDWRTQVEHTLTASNASPNDSFGTSVAASNGLLAVGAEGTDNLSDGTVYLVDLLSLTEQRKVVLRSPVSGAAFGGAVAMWGNTLMAGAWGWTDSGVQGQGAAFVYRNLSRQMPVAFRTAKGDSAPAVTDDARFGNFTDAAVNGDGETTFRSVLSGAASHSATDTGVWNAFDAGFRLTRASSSYQLNGAATILSVGSPVLNHPSLSCYPVTFKTGLGGITSLNNQAIFTGDPVSGTLQLQSGSTVFGLGTSALKSFGELVQSSSVAQSRFAVASAFVVNAATFTSLGNDSAILIKEVGGSTTYSRESDEYDPDISVKLGQLTGRVAYMNADIAYSAALSGDVTKNATIVRKPWNAPLVEIQRKGDPATFTGGTFSAFLGETIDVNETVLYRATITGSGITTAKNEGLWLRDSGGSGSFVFQKGLDFSVGGVLVRATRILNFWAIGNGAGASLVLTQITGPGVTTANDVLLLVIDPSGQYTVLMREGQPAQGCHPATIGTISRVEADPVGGNYLVLATLTGAPTDANQALFLGHCTLGVLPSAAVLRQADLFLRKGALHPNQPSRIKSLALANRSLTASGAAGTGRGQSVAGAGHVCVLVTFENGVTQLMAK